MCFSKEMSGSFAFLGLILSFWVYSRTSNLQLAIGVFYFFLMEFLQYFQYLVIDDCDNWWNPVLTLVGYIHICYQPYFTHVINSSLTTSPDKLKAWVPILRLCLVGGTMLMMRYFVAELPGWREQKFASIAETTPDGLSTNPDLPVSTEWLRGEKLCTISGKYHLAWVVPMSDVSYYTPSAAIHSFMMFIPFFILKPDMVIQGFFLFMTGPFLAAWITPNLMEQASIWCFFSIAQIGIMLILIREVLIKKWSKSGKSISETHSADAMPYIDMKFVWPMGVVVPTAEKAGKKGK
jgi:hypothetical protein